MDQPSKSRPPEGAAAGKPPAQSDLAVDEFFNQLQSDMRRPDLSQDAISAAFNAIQKMALDSDVEEAGRRQPRTQSLRAHSSATPVTPPTARAANSAPPAVFPCGSHQKKPATGRRIPWPCSLPAHIIITTITITIIFQWRTGCPRDRLPEFRPAASAAVPRDALDARTGGSGAVAQPR